MASYAGLPLINILLENVLHIYINGRHNGLAVDCRFNHAFQIGILIQITIFPSVDTNKTIIVILLNTAGTAAAVSACKADHIAGSRAIRIDPTVFIFKPYACYTETGLVIVITFPVSGIPLFFRLLKPGLLVVRKLTAVFISQVRPFGALLDQASKFISIKSEYVHQGLDRRLQVIIRLIHNLAWIKDQVIHLFTGSQIGTVSVYNIPTSVRNGPAGIFLLSLG